MRKKRCFIVLASVVLILSFLTPGFVSAATDKTKPTITGATNTTAYLYHTFNPRKGVIAKDNVDGNITDLIEISGKVNLKKVGKYTLTYKVTDSAKNTCTVKRVVTVKKDTTKPKITGATNKTVYKGYSFNPKTGVKATDNLDGNLTSKIKVSGKVNIKKIGKYKIKYTVADKTNNKTTVTRTITVKKDTTKPKITGASNKTVYMGYSFNTKTGVKATDNVDGNITSKIKISGKVNIKKVGKYKIKYTVSDKTGNKTTVTRTITVKKDTTKPKITGASNKTVYMGYSFNPKTGVKATDNLDGNITSNIKISGKVYINEVGTYKLKYSVQDKTKNTTTVTRIIKVIKDTTKPKITGATDTTIHYGDSFDPKKGVKATDNLDGTITSKMTISGSVNRYKVGTYKLTYTVKDKTGNTTTVTRIVKVVDKVAPTLSGDGLKNASINLGSSFNPLFQVKANDKVDGDLTADIKVDGEVNVDKVGTYTLIYTVKDKSGNIAKAERKITVIDNVPPIINFNGADEVTIHVLESFDPMEGVTASDNIDGDLASKVKVEGEVYSSTAWDLGAYELTYTVTDEAGNTATVGRIVNVLSRPVELTGVEDITINLGEDFDPLKGVAATDKLSGEDITSLITVNTDGNEVDVNTQGTYYIRYYLPEDKGYLHEEYRKVTVMDLVPPVISGVKDWEVAQGHATPDFLEGVSAEDNIDGDLTNKIGVDLSNVDPFKAGEYVAYYRVTDKAGNTAEEEFIVSVKYVPASSITVGSALGDGNITRIEEPFYLYAYFTPENASIQDVTWESSDESIATVDKDGVATGLREGTVTFTATGDGGITGSITIEFINRPELAFDEYGYYEGSLDSLLFSLINYDKISAYVETVKLYNNNGEVVQTYTQNELEEMGVKTTIAPSEKFSIVLDISKEDANSITNGGKIVVFAGPKDGNTYEYPFELYW